MAQNTAPVFTQVPKTPVGQSITTSNTAKDGTGTVVTLFTAEATEGSRVEKVIAIPRGTNVATVLRLWINDGQGVLAANNAQVKEVTLPATTLSEVAAMGTVEIPLDLALPAGYKLNATIGTTVAAGYNLLAIGGDY